jgi:prepilin-type N-terminal cleavage/methylation domain-containing protein/prepilin-type processing-associated H-X9-DG protein
MKDWSGTSPRPGFTLIELLAVIAVIAVLASLIITVGGNTLEHSRASEAAVQVRQILLAGQLYANEHGGHLPKVASDNVGLDEPRDYFYVTRNGVAETEGTALAAYMGGAEAAAAGLRAPNDDGLAEVGQPGRNFSYTFNFLINQGELQEGASEPSGFEKALSTINLYYVDDPSEKVIVYEEENPNDAFCVWFIDRPSSRFDGKGHVGFVDGHVELLPAEEIYGSAALGEIVPPDKQY